MLDDACGALWKHDVLDFCYIRNTYFPPSSIQSELKNHLPRLLFSYGSRQGILDEKLAWFLRCAPRNVTALNGLSQVYPILREAVGSRRVLLPQPTFGEYSRMFPAAATYRDDVGTSLEAIEAESVEAEVVVFVNPNNPTGTLLSSRGIYAFSERNSKKLIVVDESFLDFSDQPSIIELLQEAPLENVLVLKSLSKVLGVPGLRLGFVYTHNEAFRRHLSRALPIWNMNSVAEFFLEQLLKYRPQLSQSLRETMADRADFIAELACVPAMERIWPSAGNFVLALLATPEGNRSDVVASALSRQLLVGYAIYIKDVSSKFGGRPWFDWRSGRAATDVFSSKRSMNCGRRVGLLLWFARGEQPVAEPRKERLDFAEENHNECQASIERVKA